MWNEDSQPMSELSDCRSSCIVMAEKAITHCPTQQNKKCSIDSESFTVLMEDIDNGDLLHLASRLGRGVTEATIQYAPDSTTWYTGWCGANNSLRHTFALLFMVCEE
ncbi:hypothetical protein BBBOND_0209720 [Babesia bigemina]|uniref:Uncharacterized protein n=1 Tax=Babesia bigemina TaxID=5866 RepID=A0A061DAB9_BABBI|nr:hypothetical protein BBBOND_0209720 [Babesia bigemina]CDR95819.1 hypothetical protein BBBOND_0209720 [Babesia bigemina]|eukprot:XP_012768005.1 hypothetical protein BBBOND_0209720 [Babesia bigemina]